MYRGTAARVKRRDAGAVVCHLGTSYQRRMRRISVAMRLPCVLGLLALGCGSSAPATPPPPLPFDLVCDSTDTADTSSLHCMRIDSRDGSIRRIALDRLPQTTGSGQDQAGEPGRWKLVCDATDTSTRSDFRCLRLDRRDGGVELVVLPEVRPFPD